MTCVDHNAAPLPVADALGVLSKAKMGLLHYLKACNGELVESLFEWVAENSFKLIITLIGFITEATNWF